MATETLSFDILARDLASSSFKNMGRAALDASASMKELSSRLDKISGRVAKAEVGLKGDKEAQVEADKLRLKLVQLGRQAANPNINLEGYLRASARIGEVELALDRLDHRRVTATVDVNVNRRSLSGFLSSLGGGEGGPLAGGLGSPVGIGGLIGGGAVAAAVTPGIIGLLSGVGVGGLGIGGALALGKSEIAQLKKLNTQLKTATGEQRKNIQDAIQGIIKTGGPSLKITGAFQDLGAQIKVAFNQALGAGGKNSFAAGIVDVLKQVGGFIKSIGPQLGQLFQASLPFVKAFVTVLEQAAESALPAFTSLLTQMVKSGALQEMTDGLIAITNGLATFIRNLGPGLKPSADLFKHLAHVIGDVLGFLGDAFTVFAKILDVNVPAAAKKGVQAVVASFEWWWHQISSIFATVRHFIAASWDATWTDTKNIVKSGISAVVGFFKALPGRVIGALFGLGHSLYAFAHAALNEMWDGFKAVGGAIIGWLGRFVSSVINTVKKLLGIGSPSAVFHEIGVNMMLGLERGIKASAHKAADAARGAVSGAGAHGGPTSASAAQAQRYAQSRLAAYGWGNGQMGPLILLWNQESGWNRFARNPSSGAYGIPQALPPGKMGALANPPTSSAAAQINWGLGYIKSVYGSPAGAWAHERAFNWYGSGGIIGEPVVGVGLRSGRGYGFGENGPEMVTPASRGGGQRIVLQFQPGAEGTLTRALVDVLTRHVRDAGGGDVQVALGTAY